MLLLLKDGKIINSNFENNTDYFAKHKTLDVIGDLSLMGLNLIGNYQFTILDMN